MIRTLRCYCCLLFLSLPGVPAYAQSVLVMDAGTDTPLAGAAVIFYKGEVVQRYTTDSTGRFSPAEQPSESLKALVSQVGYETRTFTGPFPDTVYLRSPVYLLGDVVIQSFGLWHLLQNMPAPGVKVEQKDIGRFQSFSFLPAVNVQPGVRLEQRSPGSYRIAIRGTTLRSPFGVRNVKTYLNGLPFTEANGNTPLNLIDPDLLRSMSVIRGPSGSFYGAGHGGVLLLDGRPYKDSLRLQAETTGGTGMGKVVLKGQVRNDRRYHSGAVAWQNEETDRKHTGFERKSALYQGSFKTGTGERLSVDLLYSKIFYEIPGGLTAEELALDPRQARPGSEAQNASINQEVAWGGFRYSKKWGAGWYTEAGIYSYGSFFDHPFIFDYKREVQVAGGGRGTIRKSHENYTLILGGEYQKEVISAQNLGNAGGKPDTLNFNDEIANKSWMAFSQFSYYLSQDLTVAVGLSLNGLQYGVNRLYDAALDSSYQVSRTFSPVWVPRLTITQELGDRTTLFGSLGYGYSPPTLDEFRTNEGSLDQDLYPEKSVNAELGIRQVLLPGVFGEANAFYLRQKETIVTRQSPRGTQLFDNAGRTNQWGLETRLAWSTVARKYGFFRNTQLQATYARYWFRFDDYLVNDTDYSGNTLPGTAPHNLSFVTDVNLMHGLYLSGSYAFTSPIPLNDANSVYGEETHMVRARAGWRKELHERLQLELYAGADNLLNSTLSLGNDLNAFGGRYFQPGPGRRIYYGLIMTFK